MVTRRRCASYVLGLALVVSACGDETTEPLVSAQPISTTTTTGESGESGESGDAMSTTSSPDASNTTATGTGSSVAPMEAPPDTILVGWSSGVIAVHDLTTGKIVDTLTTEAYPEGQFFADLRRAPNGTAYIGAAYEDSWYSCDYIDGDINVIDTDGSIDRIAPGGPPSISPDGTKLAYLTSSDCVPDPDNELWFVSNFDTLVVRTLATGAERSWTFPGARYVAGASSVIRWPVWSQDSVLVMSQDRLLRIDIDDPVVMEASSGRTITLRSGDPSELWLRGVRQDGTVVGQIWPPSSQGEPEAPGRLVEIDPATGREIGEIATTVELQAFEVDRTGEHWAIVQGDSVIVDGRAIDLEVPSSQGFLGDDMPLLVGW